MTVLQRLPGMLAIALVAACVFLRLPSALATEFVETPMLADADNTFTHQQG